MTRFKTRRTALGTFELSRHKESVEFVCDRCLQPKISKIRVTWKDGRGVEKTLCNGCYGRLVAPAAELGG